MTVAAAAAMAATTAAAKAATSIGCFVCCELGIGNETMG
jgi:hypothetical protein